MTSQKNQLVVFTILDTPAVGGAEENLLSIFEYLTRQKHTVILATNNQAVKTRLKNTRVNIHDFPFRLDAIGNWKGLVKYILNAPLAVGWLVRALYELKRTYPRAQIVCFQPGFSDRLLFTPVFKLFKLPLVWLEHGPLEPTFAKNAGLPKVLYQLVKNMPQHTVTISQTTKDSLITTGGLHPNAISIIYPGVNELTKTQTKAVSHLAKQWLQKHGLEKKLIVTCVGRLAKEKQFDVAINALKFLPSNRVVLLIIGDGPERLHLEKIVSKQHLHQRVFFTGYISPELKAGLVLTSKAFIFPSAWNLEGFGLTTAEAMMLGVPVITTGAGPQQEIVHDGKTGYYFQADSPDSLAKTITKVMKDPQSSKIAAAEKEFVSRHFTATSNHKRLEQILLSFSAR